MNDRMPYPSSEVRVLLRLPIRLRQRLIALASKEGTDVNALIVRAVSSDLQTNDKPKSSRRKKHED